MRPKFKVSHPNISNAEISSLLGKLWNKQQKSSIRDKFQKMATVASKLHKESYPNYKYQPKSRKEKKAMKEQHKNILMKISVTDPFLESIENFPIETCDFPVSSFDI